MSRQQFDEYRQEYSLLLQQILASQDALTTAPLVDECQILLDQMKLEARCCPDRSIQTELWERHALCVTQLTDWHDLSSPGSSGPDRSVAVPTNSPRTDPRDHFRVSNETLERARRVAADTEQVGAQIVSELREQRETIQTSQARVRVLHSLTDTANGIVTNMSQPWWRRR